MFEDHDEELEFWSRVPDGRFDRFASRRQQARSAKAAAKTASSAARHPARPVGSRTHDGMSVDDTRSNPVVTVPGMVAVKNDTVKNDTVKNATQHVDPLMRRAGALAATIALLVPVALALRSGDGSPSIESAATTVATVVAAAPVVTVAQAAAAIVATSDTVAAAAAPAADVSVSTIDIDALPKAVPVHTAAPKSSQAEVASAPATAPAVQPTAAASPQTRVERAPAARPTCTKKYTVKAGDAWITIAKKAGVTTKELLKANAANSTTAIYPGRDICLPANATTPAAAPATTVKPAQKSAAPKPTTTTAPFVPARTYTKAEVAQIIRDVWPDELEDEAIRIATRESNLLPTAKNFCCYGLFQVYYNVHQRWLGQMGITNATQLLDPRTNAQAGLALWNRSGSWAPWNG